MRRQIVIGNWKLNGSQNFVARLLRDLVEGWVGVHKAEVVVCPAFVHIAQAYTGLIRSNIALGAQDVSRFSTGAYTGDVSAEMLHDLGCHYVIVGHSERRRHHRESDEEVARKFEAAQAARLVPILCVGESNEARQRGETLQVIERQVRIVADYCGMGSVARAVVAYEPLWAVGSGVHATPEQAAEVHAFIRKMLGGSGSLTRIVYGGSVNPLNAQKFFAEPEIDGVLVGAAALTARDFLQICRAAEMS